MTSNSDRNSLSVRVALHPFFAGMKRDHLAYLTDCAMRSHFDSGDVILREGETANRFYLIETGQVVIERRNSHGEETLIDRVGSGELIGWSWMFPPYVWHFTARAMESTDVIFFYGTILRQYCESDPSLGYELFKRMSRVMVRRMESAEEKIVSSAAVPKNH